MSNRICHTGIVNYIYYLSLSYILFRASLSGNTHELFYLGEFLRSSVFIELFFQSLKVVYLVIINNPPKIISINKCIGGHKDVLGEKIVHTKILQ